MRLAFLIPAPDFREPWRWAFDVEAQALLDRGFNVDPVPWTQAGQLTDYDLILPLVAWGYHWRYEEWLRVLDAFELNQVPVANPPSLLRWNSDKRYLAELSDAGVATVPTLAVEHLDEATLAAARARFECAELVVKPPISASAFRTFRLQETDPLPASVRGARMMVQPWLPAIIDRGEYSLIFFGERLSHAVRKVPKVGEFRVQPEYGGIIQRCEPPEGAEALARSALSAAPARATYARVDIVVGNDGALQIIELELIEPALFLDLAPESANAFAEAVISATQRAPE